MAIMDAYDTVAGHFAAVFTNPLNLTALALFALLAVGERLRPARPLPPVAGWRVRGVLFLVLGITIASTTPLLWDVWLDDHRLIDARGLGDVGGALVGFAVYELCLYGWHRAMHRTPALWRAFHQLHHSAERVDVFGAFYFHPLDVVGFSFVTSLSLVGILGLTAPAATAAALLLTFCNFFQHANIRTPRWLGWIIQRPESHAVHHRRGVHAHNYSDLPLWDLLFGTLRNPPRCDEEAGFYDGASRRIADMLIGRDVSTPPG
jgi:sterol desaturase/sphingolipid hydroxylase (fatty acid hydroxylase superfamily)